jgi:hypothetical protein
METLNECGSCGATFLYASKHHRCEGEWEAISLPLPADPYAGLSWADECVARVMAVRPNER